MVMDVGEHRNASETAFFRRSPDPAPGSVLMRSSSLESDFSSSLIKIEIKFSYENLSVKL